MTVKTHVSFGMTIGLIFIYGLLHIFGFKYLEIENYSIMMGILYFGIIFPDIDEPESYIGRKTVFISDIIKRLFGHRGFTHSSIFMLLLSVILGIIYTVLYYSNYLSLTCYYTGIFFYIPTFFLGMLLHSFGDMHTKSGIKLFYPISKKSYWLLPKSLRFKTFSSLENYIWLPIYSFLFYSIMVWSMSRNISSFS